MTADGAPAAPERRTSRRTVVKTGAKLAYAVPIVAASFKLTPRGALAKNDGGGNNGGGNDDHKIFICHSTCSTTNPYNLIEVSVNALKGHCDDQINNLICLHPHTSNCGNKGPGWPDIIPALTEDGEACCPDTVGGQVCGSGNVLSL